MADKIASILLDLNAVTLRTTLPFRWASGIISPIYTDNRILMSYPKEREIIVDSFVAMLKKSKIDFYGFAGTATAGIPWASWLAQKMKKPLIYVRSSAKDHGKENLVEGKVSEKKKYIVVEDLISTVSSSISTISAVRQTGGLVEHCTAIFTYELERSKINLKKANVSLLTLTNFTSLVGAALKKKYISKDELERIMEWKRNPEGWAVQ